MKFMKQRQVGNWWGGFKQLGTQIAIYITMLNLVLLAATAYTTTFSTWFRDNNLEIPFWLFMGVIVAGIIVMMFVEYKFSLPSFFSFWNDQFWKHNNPVKIELKAIRKENKELKESMAELKELINAKSTGD